MAEIWAIIGTLLALEIIFPAILIAWWLTFPASVERARQRLDRTPWKCFVVGLVISIILLFPIFVLAIVLPLELTRITGSLLFFIVFAFSGLGAAGLAIKMVEKLNRSTNSNSPPSTTQIRGSFFLELAAGLWLGAIITAILLPAIITLLGLPLGLGWAIGWSIFFFIIGLGSLGLAIKKRRQVSTTDLMRGAISIELAASLPIIGWFIATPLMFIMAVGAAIFAIFWRRTKALPQATE